MSGISSPSRPVLALGRIRPAGILAIGVLWAALLLISLFDHGPVDDASACRRMIYRDPVTGREQGIGEASITSDGTMNCQNVSYRPGSR